MQRIISETSYEHQKFLRSQTWKVYQEYKQHAVDSGTLPNPTAFYDDVFSYKGYIMTYTGFLYHWQKLQHTPIPGTLKENPLYYIMIDTDTKAIRLPELDIVEKYDAL